MEFRYREGEEVTVIGHSRKNGIVEKRFLSNRPIVCPHYTIYYPQDNSTETTVPESFIEPLNQSTLL
jgi:hypothetical protein